MKKLLFIILVVMTIFIVCSGALSLIDSISSHSAIEAYMGLAMILLSIAGVIVILDAPKKDKA
jgi:membrane protease YdiL (CAAX protease family)